MRVGYVAAFLGLAELLGLAGCSGGTFSGVSEGAPVPTVQGAQLTGVVHGGRQPIAGASVYLFAAASGAATLPGNGMGAAAYGGAGVAASGNNASQSLLTSGGNTLITPVGNPLAGDYYTTTDGNGNFTITDDYTCTSGQQVYVYVVGGDAGSGGNAAAGLMAALGACPTGGNFMSGPNPIAYVVVNEVSTVAAAYAMAGFATDATHVGYSGTALAQTGIANAFANAANLETIGTGVALATTPAANGGNGTVPQSEINTLADILAACVNSNGAVMGPTNATACYTLFTSATADGTSTGTQPTDTATAAINIAHNPGANVASLYGLSTANPPFAGGLSGKPNDWTVEIAFTGNGIVSTTAVAIDGAGNPWFGNGSGNSVIELSSSGTALSGASGYSGGGLTFPSAIAIDQSGNAWVTGSTMPRVVEISSSGSILSGASGYTGLNVFGRNSLSGPSGIAVDATGNVWVPNSSGNAGVSEFTGTGSFVGWVEGNVFSLNIPSGVAIDSLNQLWIPSYGGNFVSTLTGPASTNDPILGFSGGGLNHPEQVAIDGLGNAWITNVGGNSVTKLSNTGTVLSGSGGFPGGMNQPYAIAIDGAGNAWIGNLAGQNVVTLTNSGAVLSGSSGYRSGDLSAIQGIAVDGSGNVWTASATASANEIVGAATPVVTPLAVGVKNNTLGTRP